jgi:hypothetical protein
VVAPDSSGDPNSTGGNAMKRLVHSGLVVMFSFLVYGCSSDRIVITSAPSDNFQRLGQVKGAACGSLGIISTAYYFIPMGLNGRYERAYNEAIAKAPGATGLIDVTLSEDWFWWIIGTARCVTITGEAIK